MDLISKFTCFLPVNKDFPGNPNTLNRYDRPIEDRPALDRSSGFRRLMHHPHGHRAIVRLWLFDAEVFEVLGGVRSSGTGSSKALASFSRLSTLT